MASNSNIPIYDIKTQSKINFIQENKIIFPIEINHHTRSINMSVFNPSGTMFATCADDGTLNIYNGLDYTILNTFKVDSHESALKFIAFTKNGEQIIGASIEKIFILDVFKFHNEQMIKCARREDYRIIDFKLSFGDTYIGIVWRYMYSSSDLPKGMNYNDASIYSMDNFLKVLRPLYEKEISLAEFKKAKKETIEITESETKADPVDHVVDFGKANFQLISTDTEFTKIAFYIDDSQIFVGRQAGSIAKFDTNSAKPVPVKILKLKSTTINSIVFSERFEFLIACCNDSINLIDPETLELFHSVTTRHPVLCGKISGLLYDSKPKFHLIFAGGIAAIDQARTSEGGNEIFVYNFAKSKIVTKLGGVFGNVNWIDLFKDGSGFIASGGEGVARVYRFDLSYYKDKAFE